jgi:gliding motility associated protien GldN
LLANNQITAYEYLDGRELFTDQYKLKVSDLLDRFHIIYTQAKGSTEKNPKYTIDESDVPTNEVLSYYLIERWEFDTRGNRMKTYVDAICPVLHRSGDFGGEAVKYPMFWIKYSDLRPWLAQQTIFTSDDNNLPTCTYDDFFNLSMYKGEIYKTRNLRNKSMMQLYPDTADLHRAQDSIQQRLDKFEEKLWVPDREQVIAAKAKSKSTASVVADKDQSLEDAVAEAIETEKTKTTKRSTARSSKKSSASSSKVKTQKASTSSSATKSVRRRK